MNRYDVWLSGISLRDIDPRIVIDSIDDNAPKQKSNVSYMGYTHGSRLTKTVRQSLSVSVAIGIKETDMRERDAVYQAIRKWGKNPGHLTTSRREGQRLYVEEMEIKTSGKKWTEIATLTLTAYAKPFWENIAVTSASVKVGATSGATTLYAAGNAEECPVDAEITVVGSGTFNTLIVVSNGTYMSFSGLGITTGGTVKISHMDDGTLTVKRNDTSLLPYRSGLSDDDLTAEPGKSNSVSFTTNVACTAKFSTRGRWL